MTFRGKNFVMPEVGITDERLADIEARAAAATGRLYVVAESVYAIGRAGAVASFFEDDARANAVFLAAARTDVPELVAALRAERARAEAVEADNKALTEEHDFLTRMAFYEAPGHPSHRLPWKDRAEAAEAKLAVAVDALSIVDEDVRHHLRSNDIAPALLRGHALRAVRTALAGIKGVTPATKEPTP